MQSGFPGLESHGHAASPKTRLPMNAYCACLKYELAQNVLLVEHEVGMPIRYGVVELDIGYCLDIVVERRVVLKLKAVESVAPTSRRWHERCEDGTHGDRAIFTTFVPSSKQGTRASCNLRGKEREVYALPPGRRNDSVGCPAGTKPSW
jgi:PD-(D/E)XK nuclease superfamily